MSFTKKRWTRRKLNNKTKEFKVASFMDPTSIHVCNLLRNRITHLYATLLMGGNCNTISSALVVAMGINSSFKYHKIRRKYALHLVLENNRRSPCVRCFSFPARAHFWTLHVCIPLPFEMQLFYHAWLLPTYVV